MAPPRWPFAAGLLFAVACAHGDAPAFERFDPRVTPAAADYPDVGGVVLLDRGRLTFGIDARRKVPYARWRRYRRVKILRPEGLSLARVEVPYDPRAIVRGLIARSVQPDGTVRHVNGDGARDLAHRSGRRAKALDIPGASVGSVIEHAVDVYTDDLRFLPPWAFQNALPTVRSEFAVVVPEGFSVDLRFSEDGRFVDRPPERFEVAAGTRFSWSMTELPAQFEEPDMPRRGLLSPRAHVLFRRAHVEDRAFEGFASWDDVARWLLARRPDWAELSAATVAEARRIAGDSGPHERALKLAEVLARDLEPTAGPPPPLWRAALPHPDDVLAEQRANPTSRGLLLVALLRAVGVAAVPGLAAYRDRDVLAPDAPTPRALDAVVAVIPEARRPIVLDPSQLTLSTRVPAPRLQTTRLVLARPDGAEVMLVAPSDPDASSCEVGFQARLAPSGDITGTLEARLTGGEAGALRRRLLDAGPQAYAEVISRFLHRRGVALAVDSVSVADLTALRRPLTIRGRIDAREPLGDGPDAFVRIGDLIGWPRDPGRPTRRSPLLLGVPRTVEVRGTLVLPEDYAPGIVPPAAEHSYPATVEPAPAGRLRVAFEVRPETKRRLGFIRRERWALSVVDAKRYRAYYRFLTDVRASEDAAFSVRRPPARPLEY